MVTIRTLSHKHAPSPITHTSVSSLNKKCFKVQMRTELLSTLFKTFLKYISKCGQTVHRIFNTSIPNIVIFILTLFYCFTVISPKLSGSILLASILLIVNRVPFFSRLCFSFQSLTLGKRCHNFLYIHLLLCDHQQLFFSFLIFFVVVVVGVFVNRKTTLRFNLILQKLSVIKLKHSTEQQWSALWLN